MPRPTSTKASALLRRWQGLGCLQGSPPWRAVIFVILMSRMLSAAVIFWLAVSTAIDPLRSGLSVSDSICRPGTEIGAPGDEILSVDARVSYVGAGRPCLVCSGVIDEERFRLEGLERSERNRVHAMGYSEDLNLKGPAVMDVNMRAASAAMLIIRHLVQPFLDTSLPHTLRESITNFASKRLRFESSPDCTICGMPLRIGSGGRFALTTRRQVARDPLHIV